MIKRKRGNEKDGNNTMKGGYFVINGCLSFGGLKAQQNGRFYV